jgi:16S rRNA processing protein RimM
VTEQVIVGTVGRPQGVRGDVTVRPRTDAVAERFAPGASFQAGNRTLRVAGHSFAQGRLVVTFEGVTDRDAAEALRGIDLWAEAGGTELEDDEYHDTDLIGLAAVDTKGNPLGEVVGVEHPPAQDLLVVRTASGDRLVPFVAALVPAVEPAAGRVVIDPIPGLLSEADDED